MKLLRATKFKSINLKTPLLFMLYKESLIEQLCSLVKLWLSLRRFKN